MLPPCPFTLPDHRAGFRIEGRGRPVVLLHGLTGRVDPWRALVERLRRSHRLITIDLHGHGSAPLPAAPDAFTLQRAVTCVESALRVGLLPGERFHLVGHSHAAAVALHIAQTRPQRLHSLTLVEAGVLAERADAHGRIAVPTYWLRAGAGAEPTQELDGFIRGVDALGLPVRARIAVHA
jgi:pimeloyl-ACP methyl ester carboxylesterase